MQTKRKRRPSFLLLLILAVAGYVLLRHTFLRAYLPPIRVPAPVRRIVASIPLPAALRRYLPSTPAPLAVPSPPLPPPTAGTPSPLATPSPPEGGSPSPEITTTPSPEPSKAATTTPLGDAPVSKDPADLDRLITAYDDAVRQAVALYGKYGAIGLPVGGEQERQADELWAAMNRAAALRYRMAVYPNLVSGPEDAGRLPCYVDRAPYCRDLLDRELTKRYREEGAIPDDAARYFEKYDPGPSRLDPDFDWKAANEHPYAFPLYVPK